MGGTGGQTIAIIMTTISTPILLVITIYIMLIIMDYINYTNTKLLINILLQIELMSATSCNE